MTEESQNAQLKAHLDAGNTITSLEAMEVLGSVRLSGRIFDLKEDGYPVAWVWEGEGKKRYKRYFKGG